MVPKYDKISEYVTATAVVESDSKAPIDAKTVDIKICGLDECDIESDVIISEITESGSSQIADLKIKNGEPYSISVKVDAYYALISDKDSFIITIIFGLSDSSVIFFCSFSLPILLFNSLSFISYFFNISCTFSIEYPSGFSKDTFLVVFKNLYSVPYLLSDLLVI